MILCDCSSFLGSPPALAINIKPPTRMRIKRIRPARVREFLRSEEMRMARLGKVLARFWLPQLVCWPMLTANKGSMLIEYTTKFSIIRANLSIINYEFQITN